MSVELKSEGFVEVCLKSSQTSRSPPVTCIAGQIPLPHSRIKASGLFSEKHKNGFLEWGYGVQLKMGVGG